MKLKPVLTIAGSDSSGGAGIQADLKTITMLGCYGMSAITALTAQNTMGVQGIFPIPAEFLNAQIQSVFTDIPPASIKIGMIYNAAQMEAVADSMQKYKPPFVVVDPVMVSTSGDALQKDMTRAAAHRQKLYALADLITPNLPEARALTGLPIETPTEVERAADALAQQYQTAVLIKGGHADGNCDDFLYTENGGIWLRGVRVMTKHTHGTGCTLSAAIASYMTGGVPLQKGVVMAKAYVTDALRANLEMGNGNGPIFHNFKVCENNGTERN